MTVHQQVLRALFRMSPRAREARMRSFEERMQLTPGMRVIDLGGSTKLWRFVNVPLDVTVLNLASQPIDQRQYGAHRFTIVRGDATHAPELKDNSFDLVFSNSCIEHVGPADKQQAFADTVRRLAPSYWVQTPSKLFPVEAHTGLPLWWLYPERVRQRMIENWTRSRPVYGEFIAGTRVLLRSDLTRFFPDAEILTERFSGIPKSYIAYRRGGEGKGAAAAAR